MPLPALSAPFPQGAPSTSTSPPCSRRRASDPIRRSCGCASARRTRRSCSTRPRVRQQGARRRQHARRAADQLADDAPAASPWALLVDRHALARLSGRGGAGRRNPIPVGELTAPPAAPRRGETPPLLFFRARARARARARTRPRGYSRGAAAGPAPRPRSITSTSTSTASLSTTPSAAFPTRRDASSTLLSCSARARLRVPSLFSRLFLFGFSFLSSSLFVVFLLWFFFFFLFVLVLVLAGFPRAAVRPRPSTPVDYEYEHEHRFAEHDSLRRLSEEADASSTLLSCSCSDRWCSRSAAVRPRPSTPLEYESSTSTASLSTTPSAAFRRGGTPPLLFFRARARIGFPAPRQAPPLDPARFVSTSTASLCTTPSAALSDAFASSGWRPCGFGPREAGGYGRGGTTRAPLPLPQGHQM